MLIKLIKMKNLIFKNKKSIKLLILSIILIYSAVWATYNFIVAKKIATSAVNSYLENININKEEISSLNIRYDFKIGGQYNILIKYKNEPNLKYEYTYEINKQKFILFTIFDKGDDIGIEKNIIPMHELPEHIDILYSNSKQKVEMKYSFFDYIKDIFKKDIFN